MLFPFALTSFSTLGRIQTGLALVSLTPVVRPLCSLNETSFRSMAMGSTPLINYLCPKVKARKCSPLHIGIGVKGVGNAGKSKHNNWYRTVHCPSRLGGFFAIFLLAKVRLSSKCSKSFAYFLQKNVNVCLFQLPMIANIPVGMLNIAVKHLHAAKLWVLLHADYYQGTLRRSAGGAC